MPDPSPAEFFEFFNEFGTDRLLAIKPVLTDLREFLNVNRERD